MSAVFTIPRLANPKSITKNPSPHVMASNRLLGIVFIIASLKLKNIKSVKRMLSIATAVNANCHECPILSTITTIMNVLIVALGATAIGRFARKAMSNVAIIADNAVAVNSAPGFMPVLDKIPGVNERT